MSWELLNLNLCPYANRLLTIWHSRVIDRKVRAHNILGFQYLPKCSGHVGRSRVSRESLAEGQGYE